MIIHSPKFIKLIESIYNQKNIKALSFWPIIILKYRNHTNNKIWINHEKIHHRQQIELLLIGFIIFYILNYLYHRYILHENKSDAYKNNIFENEAYKNQQNLNYLDTRKPFAFIYNKL
jgi:hypothetical protein